MATASFIDKGPSMDWSTDDNLYSRFKMWKQRCELLFTGPMVKIDEVQCKHLLYWSGEHGMELFNSWDLSADDQKKLKNYWERFENYVKPHSNELIAAWELHNLRQGTLSLEEFIAKLRILVKEANYPAEHHDRFLRDFLVLGMNSNRVRKDCFKKGNTLSFNEAREMAKAEESADKQLQLMNTAVEVHPVTSENRSPNQRDHSNAAGGMKQTQNGNRWGKTPTCRNCGWGPHAREQCPAKNATCHYCQKVGHLAKVCLSKLRKKNVYKIEASSSSNALPNSESTQPISDNVFLGPIEATPLSMNVHSISCREKALLKVSLSLGPEGRQVNTLCKIDSGAETNILPKSLYQQLNNGRMGLAQPTMRLSAYGGVEIPNLGSCQIYVKGPNNPSPKPIQAEVVDVDGPAIIGNMSAQNLNLLKLNWPITANQYSDDLISHRGTPTPQVNHTRPTHDLHTFRLFDMGGKQHPFPLTKDYLLKEYEDVFTGIGCFPGAPYHIETDPKYPILRKLNSTTSAAIINHLKSIFAEHGIPESLVTDNGPLYSSREFAAFCDQWGINHITSSPLYPKSNGFIERMVQTVKNLLKKSDAAGQDPYLALLSYRPTPIDSNLPSPAKVLNQRDYRTQLPCSGRLQRSQTMECNQEQLQHRQDVQKQQYDGKSPRELQRLGFQLK